MGFLRYVHIKHVLACVTFLFVFFFVEYAQAATITTYSDRLSTSAPTQSSNHTINFTTTVAIPAGGYIRFTPSPGNFEIPASPDFDIDNIAFYVATSSGYQLQQTAMAPSPSEAGVAITTGTSGSIEITLNSTDPIPAGASMRLLIGDHTPNATTTDLGITNPTATGTFAYFLRAGNGVTDSQVRGLVAIVEQVIIPGIDTHETVPPFRFNGAPSGDVSGTTVSVQISVETDEFARCRYSYASGTPYYSMGHEFSTSYVTVHAAVVPVASSTSYAFYVRCIDDEGNINPDDYTISFTVLAPPTGEPGSSGSDQGNGSGTGSGNGEADPGSGSTQGGTSGGGSSGGGGSGGTGGTGDKAGSGPGGGAGFETTPKPYQSGDGLVIINGYAFPRSTIVVLVDGKIAKQVTSDTDGKFSSTLDAIARGAYTFGVYGIDKNNVKSSTFSTTFTVTGSRGSTLSNINVMPSIKVSPDPAEPNSTITISGYSIPNAAITVENQNDKSSVSLKTLTATSDANGFWTTTLSTDGFSKGTYKVRAKAKQEAGVSTNFSGYTYYGVGAAAEVPRTSDLNRDGKVNLTDFSILLFWWNSDGGASNPPADINRDGKVSLTDFSIMIFNWTG